MCSLLVCLVVSESPACTLPACSTSQTPTTQASRVTRADPLVTALKVTGEEQRLRPGAVLPGDLEAEESDRGHFAVPSTPATAHQCLFQRSGENKRSGQPAAFGLPHPAPHASMSSPTHIYSRTRQPEDTSLFKHPVEDEE